jgi:hypothetical protein
MTRREILTGTVAATALAGLASSSRAAVHVPEIIAGDDRLSQESAEGFRLLLDAAKHRANLVVVAGGQLKSHEGLPALRDRILHGACVVWESHAFPSDTADQHVFGVRCSPKIIDSDELYVWYRWPQATLVRKFETITSVECDPGEAIASYAGVPIGMKRGFGRGGIVFLGSMLGPHLKAGDPDAWRLGAALIGPW